MYGDRNLQLNRHNNIFFRSGDLCLLKKLKYLFIVLLFLRGAYIFQKSGSLLCWPEYIFARQQSTRSGAGAKVCGIVKYSLFLIASPWSTLLFLRCLSWRHRHCSPLADRHEGWSLSNWLLVQPRALLLDIQWDNVSGAGSLPTVAELGRADNRDIKGTRTFLLSCWHTRCSEKNVFCTVWSIKLFLCC